jgi:serine/threonine protein phosphatase PrpC
MTVANIGDSMCVLSRGGRAVKMHRQHRLGGGIADVDERKRVEAAGGRVLNSRVNGVLAISRAFGDVQLKDYNTGVNKGPVIAVPDVVSEIITPMTEFAVIGTDGLWDTMEPQQVVNFVRQRIGKKDRNTLQETAQALTREAIARGSIDNVSVVLLSFHSTDGGGHGQ